MRAIPHVSRALATAFVLAIASAAFAADGGDWTVHKSSGEVWLAGSDVQQASLKQEDVLEAGRHCSHRPHRTRSPEARR